MKKNTILVFHLSKIFMRQLLVTITFLSVVFITRAQTNLAGTYSVSGFLYHPSASRSINLTKTIRQVAPGKYQVRFADLDSGNSLFQFELDSNNNLINWAQTGAAAFASSGFMTLDNPGNFSYANPVPGAVPYQHSVYNNTYNPDTKTFYMHYGYGVNANTGQVSYSRQIYEKYILQQPAKVISATPMSGTSFTMVTIKGNNFLGTNPVYNVRFGNVSADSAVIVSDSLILAWVGSGTSGNVTVTNSYGKDTVPGFIYIPVEPVIDTQWIYLGAAGFSSGKAFYVNMAIDTSNIPYVVFTDAATRKAKLMKFDGANWITAAPDVSDGKSSNTKLVIDINNKPVVAYADSTIAGAITVKRFNGTSWLNLNVPTIKGSYEITADRANHIYLSTLNASQINILRYDGSSWTTLLNAGQSYYESPVDIVTDNNNTPYIIFDDFNFAGNATVKKFDGNGWILVGNAGFTNSLQGIFYANIKIEPDGNPVVAFQEDDGFERISAYKFTGGQWTAIGAPKFSKGRAHNVALSIDSRNIISVGFTESSYNRQGSIRTYNATTGQWDITGSRGWLPAATLEPDALLSDRENTLIVAFSDLLNDGKVSVKRLIVNSTWTGTNGAAWENPANWSSATLPTSATNVIIPPGASVLLSTNITIHSLHVNPGASLTIAAGKALTQF